MTYNEFEQKVADYFNSLTDEGLKQIVKEQNGTKDISDYTFEEYLYALPKQYNY